MVLGPLTDNMIDRFGDFGYASMGVVCDTGITEFFFTISLIKLRIRFLSAARNWYLVNSKLQWVQHLHVDHRK